MADSLLLNAGSVAGIYDSLPTALTSDAVTTLLVEGLSILKEADKESWAGGLLTYTITIENNAEKEYTSVVFKDELDTNAIDLVADSVEVDGVTAAYTYVDGLLTVPLSDIATGEGRIITFQVQKV